MLKNITLSADEDLIKKARIQAAREMTTINTLFRQWLGRYIGHPQDSTDYHELMRRMSYVKPGRVFSREEMNER